MSNATTDRLLDAAIAHHEAGRLADAQAIYRQILAIHPEQPDALHLLAVIAGQAGQFDSALDLMRRAIAADPDNPDYHCELGSLLQQRGQLDAAIASYRHALSLDPELVEAHYNLGHAFNGIGQLDWAIESYQKAIDLNPDLAEAHTNLGNIRRTQGQLDQAIVCYRRAIELRPDLPEAHASLGVAWQGKGQLDQAIGCYQKALAINPNSSTVLCNLANAFNDKDDLDRAIASYQRALQLQPDMAKAHDGLGAAWRKKGNLEQAIASHQRALEINPDSVEACNNLGIAWKEKGQLDQAVACFRKALALKPDMAEAHSNLGVVLSSMGQVDAALASCQRALELNPNYVHAHNNLANAWKDRGHLDEAIACYRRALEIQPAFVHGHDNLLYTMHYHPAYDAKALYAEARQWNRQHAQRVQQFIKPHTNNRDPNRRLRIGYVSADFHDHASALFMLPLFRNHDRQQFQVICYSQGVQSDHVTRQLRDLVQGWRSIFGLSDASVADLVRDDRVDILIDLKVHTAGNRLLVFAQKPAPIQLTWLGNPGTTGLNTMDYRLTDPYLDPPGLDDAFYSEQSIRLPETFWCYDPLCDEPHVNALPSLQRGFTTFGCLNNFCKLNDAVLSVWAKVLNAVPGSHLLMLSPEGDSRSHALDRLGRETISPDRIEFVRKQSRPDYLLTNHRIDVALDTFPCNGHTTSLDSLWMGIPVVTLAGNTVFGRAGLSQLTNLGLTELIARTPEQYIQIATDLAADRPRLSEIRSTLRQRMQYSPLMDGKRFADNFEHALRTMWRIWCAT